MICTHSGQTAVETTERRVGGMEYFSVYLPRHAAPLAPRTARAIDLAIGEHTEGPVFLTGDGWRLDRHGAGRIVRKTARRAGIAKTVTPHTLRHAFITAALDAGVRVAGCPGGRISRGPADDNAV
jgi:integrase